MNAGAAAGVNAQREDQRRCAHNFTIFEGTSEIQRLIIGRAVTSLDVR